MEGVKTKVCASNSESYLVIRYTVKSLKSVKENGLINI